MLKLKSLKLSAADRDKLAIPSAAMPDAPRYPWGLSLSLESDTIATLLGTGPLPAVGDTLALMAQVTVTRIEASENEEGGKRRSLSLQITDAVLEPETTKKGAADVLFGA